MDIEQLATMVKTMRAAQQIYFRKRTSDLLAEAVKHEVAVDRAVEQILHEVAANHAVDQILAGRHSQPTLFPDMPAGGQSL